MDGKSDNLETGSPSRIHTVPGPGKEQGYFELVDSLCRLDDEVFEEDLDDVLSRAAERGLSRFMLGGLGPSGWSRQRELVRCNRGLAFSIGVHPWSVGRLPESLDECLTEMEVYFQQAIRPVALGEIGLDRGPNAVAEIHEQVRWLSGQLQFACTRNVPVILHVVRAHGALLEVLNAQAEPLKPAFSYETLGLIALLFLPILAFSLLAVKVPGLQRFGLQAAVHGVGRRGTVGVCNGTHVLILFMA